MFLKRDLPAIRQGWLLEYVGVVRLFVLPFIAHFPLSVNSLLLLNISLQLSN